MKNLFRSWLTTETPQQTASPNPDITSPIQLNEHPLSEFRPSLVNKLSGSSGTVATQQ